MKRAKRTRRARDTRARLEAEARRLLNDADALHGELYRFERDHLDRAERSTLDRAFDRAGEAWRALESLAASLGTALVLPSRVHKPPKPVLRPRRHALSKRRRS